MPGNLIFYLFLWGNKMGKAKYIVVQVSTRRKVKGFMTASAANKFRTAQYKKPKHKALAIISKNGMVSAKNYSK